MFVTNEDINQSAHPLSKIRAELINNFIHSCFGWSMEHIGIYV